MVSFDEQRATLVVVGEEDQLTAGRRRTALSRALRAGRDVVVDLRDLSWADSSLMVDLAVLARRLRQQGSTVCLRGAQPQIQKLIELMGMDRLPAVAVSA